MKVRSHRRNAYALVGFGITAVLLIEVYVLTFGRGVRDVFFWIHISTATPLFLLLLLALFVNGTRAPKWHARIVYASFLLYLIALPTGIRQLLALF